MSSFHNKEKLKKRNRDSNIIDKNDNKKNPLSYVNINSKTTYKSLIEYFEKNGYKCTKSK